MEVNTSDDLSTDCAPEPTAAPLLTRNSQHQHRREESSPQKAQSQEQAERQGAPTTIFKINQVKQVQINQRTDSPVASTRSDTRPLDPENVTSPTNGHETFPGSPRRDRQATVGRRPGGPTSEVFTSEASASLSSSAPSPAPWDDPAHQTDLKEVVTDGDNPEGEEGAEDKVKKNRHASGTNDGGFFQSLKSMLTELKNGLLDLE